MSAAAAAAAAVVMATAAWAGEAGKARKAEPPDPYHMQDFTAYTVERGQWRVGLWRTDYGLLDNVSVGTSPLLWLVGGNARGKVTAVQTERLAFSLEGSVVNIHPALSEALVGRELSARLTPVGWTGSAILNERWSVHLGNTWTLGRVEGTLSGEDIVTLVSSVAGGGVGGSLGDALGDDVYAGAWVSLALAQSNLAVEWRRSRRDSIVLEANSYLWASGLVVAEAGTATEGEEGETELGAGAAARFRTALAEVPSAISLSYQWSWERANLRLGVPLPLSNVLAWPQAVQVYWLL